MAREDPAVIPDQQAWLMQHEREIRRLRIWLQEIAVSGGVRATKIIGVIPLLNLDSDAGGLLVTYISFGSEPTGGQTFQTAVMYAGDIVVVT